MSETLKLRTTAFGGFARQDVVDYLEQNARQHAAQLNELRAQLKAAEDRAAALEGEKARADALAERCELLAARVEELEALEAEVVTLRAQVAEYKPHAEAYLLLKDTVADIELSTRNRCAQMVKETEDECAAKRAQAQELLDRVMAEYSRVGASANSAITDVICKLTDLRASLAGLTALQQGHSDDHE